MHCVLHLASTLMKRFGTRICHWETTDLFQSLEVRDSTLEDKDKEQEQ
jgi:hypothetical protein